MPAYKTFKKPLIYFGRFKNHIGIYATPWGHKELAEELSKYNNGKGSIRSSICEPLPIDLITRIIKFRIKENDLKFK